LADRGDAAARPAVLELLEKTGDEQIKVAAIGALGGLGVGGDVPRLARSLAAPSKAEQSAARGSLVRLRGDAISSAMVAEMKKSDPPVTVALIEILATRRALDTIPDLLSVAIGREPSGRAAAMAALGQIAGPEHVAGMVRGVLAAAKGAERDAAEKAIMLVCGRIADGERRADSLLAAMEKLNEADRLTILTTLGRVGGSEARKSIETAIADTDPRRHEAGVRALCNWPDASVAPRLVELAKSEEHQELRSLALAAVIRVAPLPDQRPAAEKLALLQKVIAMCTRDEERKLVLKRSAAVRTVETLRFVLPYLDHPSLAGQACETVVELAHHRGLREPNKAEFHKALDKVLQTSKDAVVLDRANRYKRDQTWVRPKATEEP
jgi:HEAT repeat protein